MTVITDQNVPDIGAASEAKRIANIQDNLNLRSAAIDRAIAAIPNMYQDAIIDDEALITLANSIEDYLRGNDLPRG